MERDEVLRLAQEAGFVVDKATVSLDAPSLPQIERFAALVAAACLAAERAMMPPPPLVVDVSSIDPGVLADMMKRTRPDSAPALVSGAPTVAAAVAAERIRHQAEIQRLTALANTAEKWRGIAMARDGDGRTVQQVQAEAAAAEREACAKACEAAEDTGNDSGIERDVYIWNRAAKYCAAKVRARGAA